MTKILFDIDGVLNPFLMMGTPEGYIAVQEGWISWRLDLMKHAEWMRELEKIANIVWVSAWEEDSNTVCFYYGTQTTYEHIPLSMNDIRDHVTWKLNGVKAYLAESTEPVIWIDDELEQDAFDWAAQRGNTLLLRADPREGWTAAQYRQMLAFIQTHPTV